MAKPAIPNRRQTTWRPTPADDEAAQTIMDFLRIRYGQEPGHTGALRYALKVAAAQIEAPTGPLLS